METNESVMLTEGQQRTAAAREAKAAKATEKAQVTPESQGTPAAEMAADDSPFQRKSGRPRRERVRRSIGSADVLVAPDWAIEKAEDEELSLRFVVDRGGTGQRIQAMEARGWTLMEAPPGTENAPGELPAGIATPSGRMVRRVSNRSTGDYTYLMSIPQEWLDEDRAENQARLAEGEKSLLAKREVDDMYGGISRTVT